MDHGIINLPLAKRGNIDAQIDAHKARQTADTKSAAKAAAQSKRELKASAKDALAALISAPGLLESRAEKMGRTRKEVVAALTSWSKWEPAKLLKAFAEWMPA